MTKAIEPLPLVRIVFLALIKKYPNSSGYSLNKRIKELIHDSVIFNSGTIYNELRRMEKINLVTSYLEESKRKTRKYTITPHGEKELVRFTQLLKDRINNFLLPLLNFIEENET